MTMLAFGLAAVLFPVTVIHVYWGLGGIWPGRDEASCARAVVGFAGVREMPSPTASFAVAACLVLAMLWPLALVGIFATPFSHTGLAAAAFLPALVFLGRGMAGFTPAWRRLAPEQPFARLDVSLYSPLCLALGAGFAILAFREITA